MKKIIYAFGVLILFSFLLFITPIVNLSEASEEQSDTSKKIKEIIIQVIQNVPDGLIYQVGSRGRGVQEFQNLLISVGFSSIGSADGKYGNKTAAAVKEFQEANRLSVTGKADLATQIMLLVRNSDFSSKGDSHIAKIQNYAISIWENKACYVGAVDASNNFIEGTYYYLTGDYYAGEYKNNLRSGKGTAHFANGDVYVGQWKDDTMNGNGTYYYGDTTSTEYYKGNMTDNKMNGKGTYYLNGKKITGKWANNRHLSWK